MILLKILLLFSCVNLNAAEFSQILKLVYRFTDIVDSNVTRVRTPLEFQRRRNEFVLLDFIGLVEQHEGYKAEEYDVQTHDGYILKLHRISSSPFSPKYRGKPVVYMQHPLVGSSDVYVMVGPKRSLAFQLADAGYDIWLGNVRGNTYSKRHVKYSAANNNAKFWDFSMDEMALIDLPIFIDTTLEKTGSKKLAYVGYSMGTALSFLLLSTKPEYNAKISIAVSIAPVASFSPPYSQLVKFLKDNGPFIENFVVNNRLHQLLPQSKILRLVGRDVCVSEMGAQLCKNILSILTDPKNLDYSELATFLSYFPAGTSANTFRQYYQMMLSGSFEKFDFGVAENTRRYNLPKPPSYDFRKITAPQALFYAPNDAFVNIKDAIMLKNKLPPNKVYAFMLSPMGYNHLDFVLARNVKEEVYDYIVDIINSVVSADM